MFFGDAWAAAGACYLLCSPCSVVSAETAASLMDGAACRTRHVPVRSCETVDALRQAKANKPLRDRMQGKLLLASCLSFGWRCLHLVLWPSRPQYLQTVDHVIVGWRVYKRRGTECSRGRHWGAWWHGPHNVVGVEGVSRWHVSLLHHCCYACHTLSALGFQPSGGRLRIPRLPQQRC